MDEPIHKKDIEGLEDKIEELLEQQRRSINQIGDKINQSTSKIISVLFSENRKIRQEIGNQTIILKILEDNLEALQFDDSIGVSSKKVYEKFNHPGFNL